MRGPLALEITCAKPSAGCVQLLLLAEQLQRLLDTNRLPG